MILKRLVISTLTIFSFAAAAADDCEGALGALSPFARLVNGAYAAGALPLSQIEITAAAASPTNPLASLGVTAKSAAYHAKFSEMIVSPQIISQWPAIQIELRDLFQIKTRETKDVEEAREKTEFPVQPQIVAEVPGVSPWVPITKDSKGDIWIAYLQKNRLYARNLSKPRAKIWKFPDLEKSKKKIEYIGWLSSTKTEPVLRLIFQTQAATPVEGLRAELGASTAKPFTGPKWLDGFMYPAFNTDKVDAWGLTKFPITNPSRRLI